MEEVITGRLVRRDCCHGLRFGTCARIGVL